MCRRPPLPVTRAEAISIIVNALTTSEIGQQKAEEIIAKNYKDANKAMMDLNLKVDIKQEYSDTVAEGNIISQFPEGGEKTPENSTVLLTVSQGAAENLVKVPNVLGKDNDEAVLLLTEAGLTVNPVAPVYDNVFPEGQICYQSLEADKDVPKGTAIDLHASMGPEPPDTVLYRFNFCCYKFHSNIIWFS